jgi:Putative GTPase activating protein for Arf
VRLLAATSTLPHDLVALTLLPTASDAARLRNPLGSKPGEPADEIANIPPSAPSAPSGSKSSQFLRRSNSFRVSKREPSSSPDHELGGLALGGATTALPAHDARTVEGSVQFKDGSKWKKRFMVANDTKLFVAHAERSLEEVVEIDLFCASVRRDKKQLTILTPASAYHFRCDSVTDAENYARLLGQVCQNMIHKSIGSKQTDFEGDNVGLRASKDVDSASTKRIKEVQGKDPGNAECADCGRADPDWCSITLGVFICSDCSGGHRSVGTDVSQGTVGFLCVCVVVMLFGYLTDFDFFVCVCVCVDPQCEAFNTTTSARMLLVSCRSSATPVSMSFSSTTCQR